jgi:hypothetical protein
VLDELIAIQHIYMTSSTAFFKRKYPLRFQRSVQKAVRNETFTFSKFFLLFHETTNQPELYRKLHANISGSRDEAKRVHQKPARESRNYDNWASLSASKYASIQHQCTACAFWQNQTERDAHKAQVVNW